MYKLLIYFKTLIAQYQVPVNIDAIGRTCRCEHELKKEEMLQQWHHVETGRVGKNIVHIRRRGAVHYLQMQNTNR